MCWKRGQGQRGAVTSRVTPSSCGESRGDTVCATNLGGGRTWGQPGFPPPRGGCGVPRPEVAGHGAVATSRLDIPPGGGSRLRPAPISRTQTIQRSLGASPGHYSHAMAAAGRVGWGWPGPGGPYGFTGGSIWSQIPVGCGGRGARVRAAGPPAGGDPLRGFGRSPPQPVVRKEQSASLYSFTSLPYFCLIEIYKIQIHQKKPQTLSRKGILL